MSTHTEPGSLLTCTSVKYMPLLHLKSVAHANIVASRICSPVGIAERVFLEAVSVVGIRIFIAVTMRITQTSRVEGRYSRTSITS